MREALPLPPLPAALPGCSTSSLVQRASREGMTLSPSIVAQSNPGARTLPRTTATTADGWEEEAASAAGDDDDDDDENDDDEDNFYEKLKKDEDYLNLIPIKTLMLGIDDDEKNKGKIIEEHRLNCMKHFEIIMNSPNEINIVNLLKLLFGNIAVCVNIKPLSWYFYENQLWNDDKKESYRNLIDEELHPIFVNYTKLLSKLKQNYTDNNDETLEILKKLLLRSNQIADRLMTTTNRNNYCVELRSKCFKIDFC
jgi:hypothetical protein